VYNPGIVPLRKFFKQKAKKPDYDFLDLGCKKGSSIGWSHRKYGGRGLGVDMKQEWIDEATKAGYDAICADVLTLDYPENSFRYVAMMDFLEHLPDQETVMQVLERCKKWSREFFFIHHPSFEDIDYLKGLGLKIDWTDGYDHNSPITLDEFKEMFKQLGLRHYTIEPKLPIADSSDKHILPLDAPHNTIFYNKSLGPKKKVTFDRPVYSRFEIVVSLEK